MGWGFLMEGGMSPKGRFGLGHFNTKSSLSTTPTLICPPPPVSLPSPPGPRREPSLRGHGGWDSRG